MEEHRYAWESAVSEASRLISAVIGEGAGCEPSLPTPGIAADLAAPMFRLARERREDPSALAARVAKDITLDAEGLLSSVQAAGGYVNFTLHETNFIEAVFEDFLRERSTYGSSTEGAARTVIVDYSSPNIAKPFSIGHIRSTIIGQALYNIYSFLGYTVVGDNHLGDWGTQFGKLITAFKHWGDKEILEADPIREMLALYVRFHQETEGVASEGALPSDEDLEPSPDGHPLLREARAWFRRLEEGDPEARALWQWFTDLSLRDFNQVYGLLGIKFDLCLGESFYNTMLDSVVCEAEEKGIVEQDPEGTKLIRLDSFGINTPLLIQKKDGTSLYATRDLACAKYRVERYNPELIIYVVGSEQKLYFRQWITVFRELLGYRVRCEHVDFGLVTLPEGKMSTRKGRVVFLEEVLREGISRAREILEKKKPDAGPEEKEKIAKVVGIGAIKYNDLSQSRIKNVTFDWDRMLNFDGDSAPYLQYSYARARSILRKAASLPLSFNAKLITLPEEVELVKMMSRFPSVVRSAAETFHPHLIAGYLFGIAQSFSAFYRSAPVLRAGSPELEESRLLLVELFSTIMRNGLFLLGVECLEEM